MNDQEIRFHMPFDREDLDEMARKIDISDARNEGLAVGRQVGKQEGIEEGKIVGIEETKVDTAIRMLKKGIKPPIIEYCVELSLDQILELQASL